ncbi:MAG TPA: hypothetical protein VJ528_12140 [Geothrix sp.]|nr:hypothetical protein [Geothrix sp.]
MTSMSGLPPPKPALAWIRRSFFSAAVALLLTCSPRAGTPGAAQPKERAVPHEPASRILFLHHSTGEAIWEAGLPQFFQAWNATHGTRYAITEMTYPMANGGHTRLDRMLPTRVFRRLVHDRYPWENNPYDYWNLWVAHTGTARDRQEPNLDDLAASHDVIVFKHCFPVSRVLPEDGASSVASPKKTLANYRLQYEALKTRMHQFPRTTFIVWTGPALTEASTTPEEAERARQFATWVKETWDEKGDNIFVWDFRELETEGGLYLKPAHADGPTNAHPSRTFAGKAAPLLGRRIVDVIEGRGDQSSLTGG